MTERWHRLRTTVTRAAWAGFILWAATGCGARSAIEVEPRDEDGAGGGDVCETELRCTDITRGTLLLEMPDGTPFGSLFLFDGAPTCNLGPTAFLLTLSLEIDGRPCSRAGGFDVGSSTDAALVGSTDNLGGSTSDACGGTPFGETLRFTLMPIPCEPERFDVTVENDEPGSPYAFEGVGERCRCDVPWNPCAEPLPDEICEE